MYDLNDVRDAVEAALDLSYVESEGAETVRFDLNGCSCWVHKTGSIEGNRFLCAQVRDVIAARA